MDEANRLMQLQDAPESWWHNKYMVEERFYDGAFGRWRLKCWLDPKSNSDIPYAIYLFHPSGGLVCTFLGVGCDEVIGYIEEEAREEDDLWFKG